MEIILLCILVAMWGALYMRYKRLEARVDKMQTEFEQLALVQQRIIKRYPSKGPFILTKKKEG